jgi:hypothetical protein
MSDPEGLPQGPRGSLAGAPPSEQEIADLRGLQTFAKIPIQSHG